VASKAIDTDRMGNGGGYSLLELLIVVVVMAVLLTIAIPSYRQYSQRAERADAIRGLLSVASCQERIRAATGFYDTTQCIYGLDSQSYHFRINPPADSTSEGFEALAEPVYKNDNSCGSLSLDHTGARGISVENGSLPACWGGR